MEADARGRHGAKTKCASCPSVLDTELIRRLPDQAESPVNQESLQQTCPFPAFSCPFGAFSLALANTHICLSELQEYFVYLLR